ncbi:unnamed protein product [Vicia faba]|uniref:Uncharacterized protein n=1 Tax=Vicia faba TaxID=3906 RepID=A0AAV1A3J4_VICFA|nr:unnamed protein product [Vicia faba]
MQDKYMEVKVFNVGEDMTAFLCNERFLVGTYSKLQPGEALYQDGNLRSSSSKVKESDVGSLITRIEELKSSIQCIMIMSITEAEYTTTDEDVKEALWLTRLMREFGVE